MRITSVTLRNCRLHSELKVDFDPFRTLIGGPNETGKSTLIEAVHRALFLKAKGNTEHHRSLKSWLHPGNPEVELAFEAGGNTYLLKKRFGPAGTTTLAPSNSVPLADDAAEGELARLLSVAAGITGRAIVLQWSHLWVWQGQAGDDPSAHATAQQNGLLQRLQLIGGAAALQSELDARVAKHFADAKDQIYTQADRPKKGSDLERAESTLAGASTQLEQAKERVRNLESAATNLEAATLESDAAGTTLVDLQKQQEETEAKLLRVSELRLQEAGQTPAADHANNRLGDLVKADQQILAARTDISKLAISLEPQDMAIEQLKKATQDGKIATTKAEEAHNGTIASVRAARLRCELASAHILLFEKAEIHARLTARQEIVSRCRGELFGLEEQLATLPKVDKPELHKIQKLDTELSKARAALQAMATGLKIIAADQPVLIGGQAVTVGTRHILTEDAVVQIGPAVRLEIQPSGGTSLAGARRAEAENSRELQAMLDSLGLQSVKEATEVQERRNGHASSIATKEAELNGNGADSLAEELQDAQYDLTAAKAGVERRATLAPGWKAPDDKSSAKAIARELEGELSEAERLESEAKTARDRLATKTGLDEEALNKQRTETEQQRIELSNLNARLHQFLENHGDDTIRSRALIECQSAKNKAQDLLRDTTNAIAALQPELLERDRTRIARAIKAATDEQIAAGNQIAVAKAALRSDGSEDPAADLASAEAKARSAGEHRTSVERKSQAIALLDQMFQEAQHSLAEQFTQPLADKISGYLQCIFGAGARAQVDLENNEFTGLRLSRPGFGGAPFAFESLSGGAKEQTAAAVRLAMAEVLAADHGGCLPVVFDDAFAYSDPERVNQLQRMLDLAATRGLQVIILTCNPVDYASLGAKPVSLRPERHGPSVGRNPVPELEADSSDATPPDPEAELPSGAEGVVVTPELCESLLRALSALGGSKGNQTLRQELGWDDPTYRAVRQNLMASGKLVSGRGRGGSVSLTNR